jgi:glucose-6-phosphate 1-dehydrogenase
MNIRAFIKQYSKKMSGHKKFTLLLAYLVKGESGKEKSIEEIKKQWNKLKSVLKNQKKEKMEFNNYYISEAKNNNWVNSKRHGFCYLTNDWKKIFLKGK